MSRWELAKAELEAVLLERPRESALRLLTPTRYAAISVIQPYAWLLAHASEWPAEVLGKTIENRSRPTNRRGPVLIHVSRRWEHVEQRLAELRRLGLVGGVCPEPSLAELRAQLGQVIAVAQLVGCRRVGDRDHHPWAIAGAWGWELERPELVVPFGLSGQRGLWFTPPNVSVRPLSPKLELGGLPYVPGIGLCLDDASGRGSAIVTSISEALRVLVRAGVKALDYVVELDGELVTVIELLARAAEEHGEPDTAARLRWREAPRCVDARELADRGPLAHACGGRHG